jgi:predicted heme/steroid binding protein
MGKKKESGQDMRQRKPQHSDNSPKAEERQEPAREKPVHSSVAPGKKLANGGYGESSPTENAVANICSIIMLLFSIPLLYAAWVGYKQATAPGFRQVDGVRVFSAEELAKFDGKSGSHRPIYVAYLGEVFDVSKGRKHYGAEGGYSFFAGKDGARAYATGEFNEKGLVPEVIDLGYSQLYSILDWRKFFREHKEYFKVGVLDGLYYDKHGKPTAMYYKLEKTFRAVLDWKKEEENEKKKHPSCNSRASKQERVIWCNEGVPRQVTRQVPGSNPQVSCACYSVEEALADASLKAYEDCDPKSSRCDLEPML